MLKHTLSLAAAATLVASLEANELTVEPIVISAIKTEQSLKNTTSNVDIITAEELEERHTITLIDALRSFTNIPITQNGGIGQTSSFFQRGFSSDNTIIMVNGIRYNDPTTTKGQAQLEHLMISDIERIEIINGAQSGIWGANAVAGVINIITKEATEKLRMNATTEYGSYATTKLSADASQKLGKLSYYLGFNRLSTKGISAATPRSKNPEEYEADGYINHTFNAKLGYDLTSADTLSGQFTYISAASEYDYSTSQPNSGDYKLHQNDRLGNITYRHHFGNGDFINATYAMTSFNKNDPLGYTGYKTFQGYNKELTVHGTYHYLPNSFIVSGINTLDSKNTLNGKELDSKGIFFTNTNQFQKLIVTESLRRDTYDLFDHKTTGKIGAKYFFSDEMSLSTNYGTAYRTPSLSELYGYGGNTALKPETTKSIDATLQYDALSVTYYDNTVTNLIEYRYPAGYNNVIGNSTFRGYELRYAEDFQKILSVDLSYNRLFAQDKNSQYLHRRANESAKASLMYYPNPQCSLGTNANYIGTRYNELAQTIQTGRYTLWNIVANYAITPSITLYLKGDNMTDKRYQEVDGYGALGRTFYIGMNARI